MTNETEIFANESGTQYQGVKDKTGSTGVNPITGLITGIFKRGRLDKPMTITNANEPQTLFSCARFNWILD